MEEHIVKILSIQQVTHDVKRFQVEKPPGYSFIPGQATDVSINIDGYRDKKRPFTFTSLNSDTYLEFTIKIYPERKRVTNQLNTLKTGDELIIRDVWGAINYTGKGIFIAGGAGITPFIAIIRDLWSRNELKGNRLIFANKTRADIILEYELRSYLGPSFINILSEEEVDGYDHGYVSKEYLSGLLRGDESNFYICGPPSMIDSVVQHLENLGIDKDLITLEL
jgi:ferredoxin-NADP reductase